MVKLNHAGLTYITTTEVAKSVCIPPRARGCDCEGNCTNSRTCSCAQLNGGDFPYVSRDGGRYCLNNGIKLLDPIFFLPASIYCFKLFEFFCPSLFLYNVNVLMKHSLSHCFRLVEAKAVVFECGPQCGCGPSCVNRTSQRGLKYRLEVL